MACQETALTDERECAVCDHQLWPTEGTMCDWCRDRIDFEDDAFSVLMAYVPEEEDVDEREQRPTLRYQRPHGSLGVDGDTR